MPFRQSVCFQTVCLLTFSLFQSEGKLEQRGYNIVFHISCLTHCSFKPVINEAEVLQFHEFSGLCTSCTVTVWLMVSSKKPTNCLVAPSSLFCVYICLFSSEYPRVAISSVISSLTLQMIWNFVGHLHRRVPLNCTSTKKITRAGWAIFVVVFSACIC